MTRIKCACLAAAFGLLAAEAALAADTVPLRSFSRFELDSETADGLWGEVGSAYTELDEDEAEVDEVTVFGRLAYGSEYAEGGLLLPYYDVSFDDDRFDSVVRRHLSHGEGFLPGPGPIVDAWNQVAMDVNEWFGIVHVSGPVSLVQRASPMGQ